MIEQITKAIPPLFLFDHQIRTSLYARFNLAFTTEDTIEKERINATIEAANNQSYLARSPFPILPVFGIQVNQVQTLSSSANVSQTFGVEADTGETVQQNIQLSSSDTVRIVIETTSANPSSQLTFIALRNLLNASRKLSDADGLALGRVSFIWKRHFILDGTITSVSETDTTNDTNLRLDVVINRTPDATSGQEQKTTKIAVSNVDLP